jgi:hypothetical protein
LGGTIVVHFIKKHMWYFETTLALLEGEEVTEYEMQRRPGAREEELLLAGATVLSQTAVKPHRSQLDGGPPGLHASGVLAGKVRVS